jgi:hypothetical protein
MVKPRPNRAMLAFSQFAVSALVPTSKQIERARAKRWADLEG